MITDGGLSIRTRPGRPALHPAGVMCAASPGEGKQVRTEGVILVEHNADGQVKVSQTGDHLGRKGLGWGGGVGVVVGLFSPPMLAAVVAGGAAGGLIGRFVEHKESAALQKGLGDKLAPGTAVIVAMVDDEDRLAAERALGGSLAKSVAAMDKKGVRGLKGALAEAAGKFSPDRTVLPIPDRSFGGTTGRTLGRGSRRAVAERRVLCRLQHRSARSAAAPDQRRAGLGNHRHSAGRPGCPGQSRDGLETGPLVLAAMAASSRKAGARVCWLARVPGRWRTGAART